MGGDLPTLPGHQGARICSPDPSRREVQSMLPQRGEVQRGLAGSLRARVFVRED